MKSTLSLLAAGLVLLALHGVGWAQGVTDVGAAGRPATEGKLVEDGTSYVNEIGVLMISTPKPPEGEKPSKEYTAVFMDSKSRPMVVLPSEILERVRQRVRISDEGRIEVYVGDVGRFRPLMPEEVIMFRVIRGTVSRFGKGNFILILDGAYKVERRPDLARTLGGTTGPPPKGGKGESDKPEKGEEKGEEKGKEDDIF
jgi:hypothetical protein